jgi:hypothetical protein
MGKEFGVRGLSAEELHVLQLIDAGLQPMDWSPLLDDLVRRKILARDQYYCLPPFCPGHDCLTITKLGAWLLTVVRYSGPTP